MTSSVTVTITFTKAGQPVKWEEAAPGLSKVLAKFACRNFDEHSLERDIAKLTATTGSKTRKEAVKLLSSVGMRWKEAGGVKDVVIGREYVEQKQPPEQAASSSALPPAAEEAPPTRPKWQPTAAWRRAAELHFSPDRFLSMTPEQKGVLLDVCGPSIEWLRSEHIGKYPCLVLFPGFPDSSARLVPSYPGHPDAGQPKWSTLPRELHELGMIGARAGAMSGAASGYVAAVQAGIDMGIVDEDYESFEESELYARGDKKYDGLSGAQAVALMRSEGIAKRRRVKATEVQKAKKKGRKRRRKSRGCWRSSHLSRLERTWFSMWPTRRSRRRRSCCRALRVSTTWWWAGMLQNAWRRAPVWLATCAAPSPTRHW